MAGPSRTISRLFSKYEDALSFIETELAKYTEYDHQHIQTEIHEERNYGAMQSYGPGNFISYRAVFRYL